MGKYGQFPSGYICPSTKRIAVPASIYADSDLNGDAPAYWFSRDLDAFNMDPWRLVEGVDRHTQGQSMDLCFANGSTMTVGPMMTIFLSASDAARLGST